MNFKKEYFINKIRATITKIIKDGLLLNEPALVRDVMAEASVTERTAKEYIKIARTKL